MKFQVKNHRRKKGEPRRDIRDFCDKATIEAEHDDDAVVLNKLFRVFLAVGVGGLNLMLDRTIEEIKELKAKQS